MKEGSDVDFDGKSHWGEQVSGSIALTSDCGATVRAVYLYK